MTTKNPFSPLWSLPQSLPTPKGVCAKHSCLRLAFYRAPKPQGKGCLWFCRAHIAPYNEKYSFLKGMTVKQIEHLQWTTKLGALAQENNPSPFLRYVVSPMMGKVEKNDRTSLWSLPRQISELKILGLSTDAKPHDLHRRYRFLVKDLHPDTSQESDKGRLLQVIKAYRYLCRFLPSARAS